jgi:hypothetical protein
MLKERVHHANDPEESGSACISRVKTYKTAAGPVFLRSCCSPSFVESLKADEGLRAFARLPEREHQLLLSIAQEPENRLTLAYTASGTIVGQVSANILVARLGSCIDGESMNRFFQRLFQSETLPGLLERRY